MNLQPNKFGRYKLEEVEKAGYKIIKEGVTQLTATQLKKDFGIDLTTAQRVQYCYAFQYKKAWRGAVPVFDIATIMDLVQKGELKEK